jgi:transcriptional regulator with XRE-family HTH domain
MSRNLQLRDFLRARRGTIQPGDVGLAITGFRRVPGLRREEVAMLAGVSVDYYVRLEQGRDLTPSDSVLDALARALRLTSPQRSQLYMLARGTPRPNDAPPREIVRPNVRRLLEWLDTPAVVVGRGTAVLAANSLFNALIADFSVRSARKRYYAHWLFLDPTAREMLLDWEPFARETVGVLRASVTRFPADPSLQRLVEELLAGSAAFRTLWDRHDVAAPSSGQKRYRHRVAGEMTVLHEATQLPDDQWLYLYWVERGSPSEQAMNRLRASAAREDS